MKLPELQGYSKPEVKRNVEDSNPETITKLIGAQKAASYKSLPHLPKKESTTKVDQDIKQDKYINDNPYENRFSKRMEDAYSFLNKEIEDIYSNNVRESEEDEYGDSDEDSPSK